MEESAQIWHTIFVTQNFFRTSNSTEFSVFQTQFSTLKHVNLVSFGTSHLNLYIFPLKMVDRFSDLLSH